jgi:hypothetical protein
MVKIYDGILEGENFYDLEMEIAEKLNEMYEKEPEGIPFDKEGLLTGRFTIKITWEPF